MPRRGRKVVVIGAGAVGTTYIYALLQTGLAGEIALIDVARERVEGEVMDLSHGLLFIPPDVCLSVPCIVGQNRVVRIIDAQLAPHEQEALNQSAEVMREMLRTAREGSPAPGRATV